MLTNSTKINQTLYIGVFPVLNSYIYLNYNGFINEYSTRLSKILSNSKDLLKGNHTNYKDGLDINDFVGVLYDCNVSLTGNNIVNKYTPRGSVTGTLKDIVSVEDYKLTIESKFVLREGEVSSNLSILLATIAQQTNIITNFIEGANPIANQVLQGVSLAQIIAKALNPNDNLSTDILVSKQINKLFEFINGNYYNGTKFFPTQPFIIFDKDNTYLPTNTIWVYESGDIKQAGFDRWDMSLNFVSHKPIQIP